MTITLITRAKPEPFFYGMSGAERAAKRYQHALNQITMEPVKATRQNLRAIKRKLKKKGFKHTVRTKA
jgi:hypothetical protein